MNDLEQIMRINAYLQHQGPLTFGGKEITCVALDHCCVFKNGEEIMLDENQLAEIYRQTFFPPNKDHLLHRKAVQEIWRANTPHHLMAYGIEALLRKRNIYLTRERIETIMAELVSESEAAKS